LKGHWVGLQGDLVFQEQDVLNNGCSQPSGHRFRYRMLFIQVDNRRDGGHRGTSGRVEARWSRVNCQHNCQLTPRLSRTTHLGGSTTQGGCICEITHWWLARSTRLIGQNKPCYPLCSHPYLASTVELAVAPRALTIPLSSTSPTFLPDGYYKRLFQEEHLPPWLVGHQLPAHSLNPGHPSTNTSLPSE
jgi:hypothetical protein